MNNPHLETFVQFWEMNFNSPIPPLPKNPSDLSITQREQLRIFDGGRLYQNLFSVKPESGKLPANLENNIRKGLVFGEHKDLYREFGYEYQAQQIEEAEQQYQQAKIEKEIAESKARQEAQQKKQEEFANKSLGERMMSEPLSMGQIIDNRMKYHGKV